MILTVTVPSTEVFAAYYYGGADDVRMVALDPVASGNGRRMYQYVLTYSDSYLARCQEARFASGLYFASLVDDRTATERREDAALERLARNQD